MRHHAMTILALAAGCTSEPPSEATHSAYDIVLGCPNPINGWDIRIQGTDPVEYWSAHDSAAAIATDSEECAIYTVGKTDGILGDQSSNGATDAYVTRYSSMGSVAWVRQFGSDLGSDEDDWATGVAVASNGSVYVTGCTTGHMVGAPEAAAGGEDMFLAKYDEDGTRLWIRQFGTSGDDCANGVAVGISGGVFITGRAGGFLTGSLSAYLGGDEAFLVKYSSAGVRQFTQLLGTPVDDEAHGIAIGPSGNVYITGHTEEDLPDFSNAANFEGTRFGGQDIFLAKYDPVTGALMWLRQRGTGDDDRAHGVAVNSSNEVFITGGTDGELDGAVPFNAYGDLFVVSYTTEGAWRWTAQRGSPDDDTAYAIALDSTGAPYVAGRAYDDFDGQPFGGGTDEADAILLKFSRTGVHRWTRFLGETDNEWAKGVATGPGDRIFMTGYTNDDNLGDTVGLGMNDAFTARYNTSGDLL